MRRIDKQGIIDIYITELRQKGAYWKLSIIDDEIVLKDIGTFAYRQNNMFMRKDDRWKQIR